MKNTRVLKPYVPGEQPMEEDMVKLNTNENPYPPSKKVGEVIQAMNPDSLRLYPDPDCTKLVEALATYHKLDTNQVFVGVGSDDVLATAFLTFFNGKIPILFPDVTYSFYNVWADLYQIPYECPPIDENFRLRIKDYKKENGGIVIANPNAPTSIYEELSVIEEILQHNREVVVIVDEAYIDYAGESACSLIKKYDNLLVVRTFSKSRSMAGMRIGYCMGCKELIEAMYMVRNSYNSYTMNTLTLLAGVASLEDEEYFRKMNKRVITTREWTKKALRELGFLFPDSKTNFLFVTHKEYDCMALFQHLKEKHIYVRHFNGERIKEFLRISIGTMEEMERLIKEIKVFMAKQ